MLLKLSTDSVTTPGMLLAVKERIARSLGTEGFRLGELREVLGVSRKYTLMWAEILDSREMTRREGDLRHLV